MKTLLNTIFIIVLMLSPLAFGKNLKNNKLNTAYDSQCEYMMIENYKGFDKGRCVKFNGNNGVPTMETCDKNNDSLIWKRINNGDGSYSVRAYLNPNQAMLVASTSSGVVVYVNHYDGNIYQKWHFYRSTSQLWDTVYMIKNVGSQTCINHHTQIYYFLFECDTTHISYQFKEVCVDRTAPAQAPAPAPAPAPASESVFTPNSSDCSNGWTTIVNKGNNMCVKFVKANSRIVQATCGNGDEFLWKLVALDDGHYLIQSKKGDYVFDSYEWKKHNGNPIYSWDVAKSDNQRIQIKRSSFDTSFFNLIFKYSQKCLDVPGGSKEENLGLGQYDCIDDNTATLFKFTCPKV